MSTPKCVTYYNDKIDNMDKVNQQLAAYSIPRKREKERYKIFLAFCNSYILYCKSGDLWSRKQFRMERDEKIVENYCDEVSTTSVWRSNSPLPFSQISRLFPDVTPANKRKPNRTKQCILRSRKRDTSGKSVRKEKI